jgi:hypothetical protein
MSGRTSWWAKDSAWWRREGIVALQEECGLLGPAVVDWLTCEAKAQDDGGYVKSGCRTIAKALDSDAVTVGHALSQAVRLGLLDDLEEADLKFTCRISGWRDEQEKALGAVRKARQRARDAAREAAENPMVADDPPVGHSVTDRDMSRGVPESPLQDRTEQVTTTSDETSDSVNRVFDAWAASRSEHAGRQSTVKLDSKRRRLIRNAIKAHGIDDVLAAVQGWRQSPHHRGENSASTVYNDLGLLLRDADHIERFRDLHLAATGASVHQITETAEQRRRRVVEEAQARNARFNPGGTPA